MKIKDKKLPQEIQEYLKRKMLGYPKPYTIDYDALNYVPGKLPHPNPMNNKEVIWTYEYRMSDIHELHPAIESKIMKQKCTDANHQAAFGGKCPCNTKPS